MFKHRKKFYRTIRNPQNIIFYMASKGLFNWIPDDKYLKIIYKLRMGKKLNLKYPKTYNEKLQWLKINNRDELYTNLVDKYEVRKYIENKLGDEYLIPLLGVYDKFDEIDFDSLPDKFVLKCTHDSGGLIICDNKSKLDKQLAKYKINKSLKRNYYNMWREWPYKDIRPRIICEQYMENVSNYNLIDYKFFCFNGVPKILLVASGSGEDRTNDYFDMDFNRLNIVQYYKNSVDIVSPPKLLQEMYEIAAILSKGFIHVRIDLYEINGRVYFGEFTLFHHAGMQKFEDNNMDIKLGDLIEIDIFEKKKKLY